MANPIIDLKSEQTIGLKLLADLTTQGKKCISINDQDMEPPLNQLVVILKEMKKVLIPIGYPFLARLVVEGLRLLEDLVDQTKVIPIDKEARQSLRYCISHFFEDLESYIVNLHAEGHDDLNFVKERQLSLWAFQSYRLNNSKDYRVENEAKQINHWSKSNNQGFRIVRFRTPRGWLGFSAQKVVEILPIPPISPLPFHLPKVSGIFYYRNEPIPLIDMNSLAKETSGPPLNNSLPFKTDHEIKYVIITKCQNTLLALPALEVDITDSLTSFNSSGYEILELDRLLPDSGNEESD